MNMKHQRWIWILGAVFGIALVALLVRTNSVSEKEVADEGEIQSVLRRVYDWERAMLAEKREYATDFAEFELPDSLTPMILALLPECRESQASIPYVFLGPKNESFKLRARTVIDQRLLRESCKPVQSGFTAFAGANLDEDESLELWSINERGDLNIVETD